jgi:hypothetical protein
MRHEFLGVLVAAAVAGPSSGGLEAAAVTVPGRPAIIVRTYTQADSAGDIRAARRAAGAILGTAGIHVAWLECGVPAEIAETADPCKQIRRSTELVVRVLPAGTVDSRPRVDTLGFAFVDVDAAGGWLATVYSDRVARMAKGAGVDIAELLGRAIAHEIGHLLLGTNEHATHGLMRASWSGADLRRNRATQWLFGGKEGEVMRRGIAGRFRSENLLARY